MTRIETIGNATLYLGDCRDILRARTQVFRHRLSPHRRRAAAAEANPMTRKRRPTPAAPDAKVHGMPAYRQQEGGTGGGMRNKRSVWTIATQPMREAHFATFPEALVEPCIRAGSLPGDTVLDPFLGAGTTALVAEREGRQWIGCELNPDYVAIAERRQLVRTCTP